MGWGPGLLLAPGVQGVVDEQAALQQPLIVGLDRQAALADGQQPGTERVAVELAGDVGGVHDTGQTGKGRVGAQIEGVDEDLEGASVVAVGELGVGGIEGARGLDLDHGQHLVSRDIADLGLGVDEAADQPGTGDPVDLGTRTGNPPHVVPPAGVAGSGTSWTGRNRRHRAKS
jgi:hypothetical protein